MVLLKLSILLKFSKCFTFLNLSKFSTYLKLSTFPKLSTLATIKHFFYANCLENEKKCLTLQRNRYQGNQVRILNRAAAVSPQEAE